MEKTENFQLNQWDTADFIRREDFNRDNAKIDAALAGFPLVKLLDVTTTEDAQQVDLDISGIEWEKYGEVILYAKVKTNTSEATSQTLIRINGDTDGHYHRYDTLVNSYITDNLAILGHVSTEWAFLVMRIPYDHAGLGANCLLRDKSSNYPYRTEHSFYSETTPRSEMTTINFTSIYPLAAGCRFVMMGVQW